MICGFDNIIDLYGFLNTDGVGLKDISGLIMRQQTALNVIRIVCQIDLDLVIDTAVEFRLLLCF